MTKKDDGGPAFARPRSVDGSGEWDRPHQAQDGMSLRDYFAAKAMQAEIITSCSDATPESAEELVTACAQNNQTAPERIAQLAYLWADAMIEARRR